MSISILILAIFYTCSACDSKCREEFKSKFANISKISDCISNTESDSLFGVRTNFYRDPEGHVFCYRKSHAGHVKMSSVSGDFADPRFVCSNGPMTWYRGRRNIAFDHRQCLFWDTVVNSSLDISDGSSSSYSMRRIVPDEFENFCRNPDKNPLGPWCYAQRDAKVVKIPCFKPCRKNLEENFACLDTRGFPYSSADYDLSDILDLPQLIATFQHVHLMFESRLILPIRAERRVTKTCINSGRVAEHFGPWIAVLDENAKGFLRIVGRRTLGALCVAEPPVSQFIHVESWRESRTREGIEHDELTVAGCSFWRKCFAACQDDVASCWDHAKHGRYFGTKSTAADMSECLAWTEAASEIIQRTRGNHSDPLIQIYHNLLFEDPDAFFVKSRLFLNTEKSCMMMQRKNEAEMRRFVGVFEQGFSKNRDLWEAEFAKMFQNGPGCFVKKNRNLTFELCYPECVSNSSAKLSLTRELCFENGEYGLCITKNAEGFLERGRFLRSVSGGISKHFLIFLSSLFILYLI